MSVNETVIPRAGHRPGVPRGVAMAGLAIAVFLVILDSSMVNLAGPTIREELGLTGTEWSAVVDGYLVPFAGLLLLGGRFADVLGGRKVFMSGLGIYAAASVLCALAVNGEVLIAGRIGQGIGAAALVPAALSLVLGLYTSATERTRAMGMWGAIAGAGSLFGVFLGGAVTQSLGWQSVFWIPVPVSVAAALVVWRAVPSNPGRPGRFDVLGAATITLGVSAIALGMIFAPEVGWGSARTIASLAVGVAGLAAFVFVERRSANPLVPLGVFRRKPVVIANLMMLLLGGTLTSLFFFLPQYQQHVLDMDPATSGMSQLPIAVMIIVGAIAAPPLAKLIGHNRAIPAAIAVLFAGLLWLTLDQTATGFSASLFGAFTLIGGGLGLGLVYVTALAVRDTTDGEGGLLSGLISATQPLGGAVGLAAVVGIAATASGGISYSTAFLGLAGLALGAFVLSLIPTAKPTHS